MKRLPESLIAVVILMVWLSSALAGSVQVGWIESLQVPGDGYVLQRDGVNIAATVLTPVHVGDRIIVVAEEGHVQASLNGISTRIDQSNSPFTVGQPEEGSVLSVLVNKLLGVLDLGSNERYTVSAVSRGGFGVPALSAISPRVLEQESLYVAWNEGDPPYVVSLLDTETEAVLWQITTENTWTRLEMPDPLPREFILNVSDTYSEATYVIRVAEEKELPQPPQGIQPQGTPAEQALYACWLYTAEDGAWGLEALQQLAMLAEAGEPLARAVIDKL